MSRMSEGCFSRKVYRPMQTRTMPEMKKRMLNRYRLNFNWKTSLTKKLSYDLVAKNVHDIPEYNSTSMYSNLF